MTAVQIAVVAVVAEVVVAVLKGKVGWWDEWVLAPPTVDGAGGGVIILCLFLASIVLDPTGKQIEDV